MISNKALMIVVKDIEFRLKCGYRISNREQAIYDLWGGIQ